MRVDIKGKGFLGQDSKRIFGVMRLGFFIDKIIPSICAICGRQTINGMLCVRCDNFLQFLDPLSEGCRRIGINKVFVLWDYDKVKKLIWKLKFERDFLVRDIISWKLREYMQKYKNLFCDIDVTSFVPMHWTKYRFIRRFNPSYYIAEVVADFLDISSIDFFSVSFRKVSLHKIKGTSERARKIRGMFWMKKDLAGFNRILLVDDVLTSGATLSYLCKLVRKSGVDVVCLALCG